MIAFNSIGRAFEGGKGEERPMTKVLYIIINGINLEQHYFNNYSVN